VSDKEKGWNTRKRNSIWLWGSNAGVSVEMNNSLSTVLPLTQHFSPTCASLGCLGATLCSRASRNRPDTAPVGEMTMTPAGKKQ
jgi:hypothetical protein